MKGALVRCFCLGAVLFAGGRLWQHRAHTGNGADVASRDEILLREARRRGLDRSDVVVAQRLVQNMAFVEGEGAAADLQRQAQTLGMSTGDLVVRRRLLERVQAALADGGPEPTEVELRAYVAEHTEDFTAPAMTAITQIDLGADPAATARARDLLTRLASDPNAGADVAERGAWPRRLPAKTDAALARMFGASFAKSVEALPEGTWSGPLQSTYGVHLVRVEERRAPQAVDFELVRERARAAILAERRQASLNEAIARRRSEAPR